MGDPEPSPVPSAPTLRPDTRAQLRSITPAHPFARGAHDPGIGLVTTVAVLILAVAGTMGGLFGGPPLGDHEALVAECARNMRLSGDWVVPRFLDTPFVRKPPLGYWLVAAGSYLYPPDAATGLPVTPAGARLPSALAALGTVLLLWKLGGSMFGSRVGATAATLASASIFVLLYAPNATVEMLLTFCCTWAVTHFWFAISTVRPGVQLVHMLLFYVALGMGMLAKGPAPLAMVAVPLAIWWYLERPQRLLAGVGAAAVKASALSLVRGLGRRTLQAITRLWVFPGVLIFLAVFVPWMIAVAREQPYAWRMWNWQYFQRFQGDFEDTRERGAFYYIPIALGLLGPWTLAVGHGLAAPWMARFRARRRELFFVGVWGVVGVAVMSAMGFKKPYYILPAMPPLILLCAPIVDAFFHRRFDTRNLLRTSTLGIAALLALAPPLTNLAVRQRMPDLVTPATVATIVLAVGIAAALAAQWRNRPRAALLVTAMTITAVFLQVWYAVAPSLTNFERVAVLHRQLLDHGVPEGAAIFWADQRPDARLRFYYNRRSAHLVNPADIVMKMVERKRSDVALQSMAMERAGELLAGADSVYLILDREHLPLIERVDPTVRARLHQVAAVDLDGKPDDDDWVVISNASGR